MQAQAFSRARPIRFAYLVDLNEDSHSILDSIFEYSCSIWGGRFSLIIPCVNGEPLSEYVPWLKTFDPDLIYSYVDVSREVQLSLHEDIHPSALQLHVIHDSEHVVYRPRPEISPLTVGTLLPLAAAPGAFDPVRGVRIVGAMGSLEKNRFISDSFGRASTQLRNSMRSVLSEYGGMLFAIAKGDLQPRERYVHGSEADVPDVCSLLNMMAKNRRIFGVAQLSTLSTPRVDLPSYRWAESFNIVVGDTVDDRILYWNARALMPAWRDGHDVDLCIPRKQFDDPAFVEALRGFLNYRNNVNGSAGNGPNKATLRSLSLDKCELASLEEKMQFNNGWISYRHERIDSLKNCVPSIESLRYSNLAIGNQGIRASSLWVESSSAGNELCASSPQPEHMRFVPATLMGPSSGAWAIDLDVARSVDHSPYSNISHRWRFPRRLRVCNAFVRPYQITEPHGEIVVPRVSRGGLMTLFTAVNTVLPKIHLPTDHDAIVMGLRSGRNWSAFKRFEDEPIWPQLCCDARRSNAGRYFWGVYQLFGNMNFARSILLHGFWRKQLEDFGATDQRTDVRQERMMAKLKQRIGGRQFDVASADQLHALSDIVLQESDAVRMTVRSIAWTKLEADFKAFSERFEEENKNFDGSETDRVTWDAYRVEGLRQCVQSMCDLGVLHQGYEHKCGKCLHRSWISIEDLRAKIICEVCHDTRSAPVDKAWQFRLNGFLREALQRYGVGPLFWVLSRFQQRNSQSFWFEGPLDVFFDKDSAGSGKQETDIDLTMVDNGVVRMCEVKQSERQFKEPAKLARTMAKLRPDIAMIAVMEPDSPAIQGKFAEFSKELSGTGVVPELLTLNPRIDIESSPFF